MNALTHHRRRRRQRPQRGMTLIEIMIVLGVLVLMVSMVIVGFSSGRNAEVTRKVNQIANLVRYGYDKSRVTGQHYRLLVDFEKKHVVLQEGDGRMYLPATDRDGKLVEFDEGKAEEQRSRDERAEQSFNRSVQAEAVGARGPQREDDEDHAGDENEEDGVEGEDEDTEEERGERRWPAWTTR